MFRLFLIFLSLALISCQKEDETTFEKLNTKIFVSAEYVDGTVIISGETEKQFGCLGYLINHKASISKGNQIDFEFTDIEPPKEACLTAMGPAVFFSYLVNLDEELNFVRFKLDGQINKGSLVIKNNEVNLFLPDDGNVRVK